jgi:transposase-like protein
MERDGAGATPRRSYDETYKRHAVELTMQRERTVKAVAQELGIPAWQLYDRRKQYGPRPGRGGPVPETLEEAQKEIARLRAAVVRMQEREIILKNRGSFL